MAVEAYKAFEECCQEKLLFFQPIFAEDMDNTWKRILKHYSYLNPDFLDGDSNKDVSVQGVPTLEVGVTRIEKVASASPA